MSPSLISSEAGSDLGPRLKRRDLKAWDQFVAGEHARIFNLHLRLTGDREAAADLTQESFAAAYEGIHTFRGRSRPEVWLYGIALNCNRNWLRKTGRHDPPGELDDNLPDPQPTAEELAQLREQSDVVCDAVRRLPEPYRRAVALRYFAGVPAVEIARDEGVDPGTVRWRLHQAMRKLWVTLQPQIGGLANSAHHAPNTIKETQDEPGANGQLRIAP